MLRHHIEYGQVFGVCALGCGQAEGHHDHRQGREFVVKGFALFRRLVARHNRIARERFGGFGNGSEIFADTGQRVSGFEVADKHERRVVGLVILVVEGFHVAEFRVIQIRHDADGGMRVRMGGGKQHGLHVFNQRAIRRVFHVHAMLFFHDSPLGFQVRLVHAQRAMRSASRNRTRSSALVGTVS